MAQAIIPNEGAKVLVDDAIQALKNKDSNRALVHLNILNQQLRSVVGNVSSHEICRM